MQHRLQHHIGKPYEIWCASADENCDNNFVLPLENIITSVNTRTTVRDEIVLVTVPFIIFCMSSLFCKSSIMHRARDVEPVIENNYTLNIMLNCCHK